VLWRSYFILSGSVRSSSISRNGATFAKHAFELAYLGLSASLEGLVRDFPPFFVFRSQHSGGPYIPR